MAKNKKMGNVPNLRFKEFEGEWKILTLEEIGEFKNGINKGSQDFGFGVPFVNLMDVFGKPIISSNDNFGLVNANNKEIELYELKKGDVLFIRSSVKKTGVGETSLLTIDLPKTVYSGFLIRFRDNKMSLNLNFKRYCFYTNRFRNNLISLSSTSANTNINQDSLNSLNLFVPVPSEQTKVSTFLSTVDERISTQSKIIDKLKTSIQILRKKLFNQDLCFKDDNDNIYPKWETKKLRQLGTFFSGGTPLTTKRHYFDGNIPFIRSGEINASSTEQYISEEGLKNSSAKMVEVGDLIYALYGATSGEVGISKIKGAINQAILCFRTELNNVFLLNYLKFQKENILSTFLQGGQGNLSAEIIKSLKVPVPTINEQVHIANIFSSIESKIELEINILNTYQNQKQYLLSNLFI